MINPRPGRFALSLAAILALTAVCQSPVQAQQPFKLGVEERGYIQDPSGNGNGGEMQYPSPQMTPTPTLNGGAQQQQLREQRPKRTPKPPEQARAPISLGVTKSQPLPVGFMGRWLVTGMRSNVEAKPDFQAAANNAFAGQTQNVWNITGNPNSGYSFANDQGVKTQIFVDKVQGDTAFIRYQHPVGNTMAQEAIVMQIGAGGAQFSGLERISIVKQGEPQPRAKVTYNLQGRRQ